MCGVALEFFYFLHIHLRPQRLRELLLTSTIRFLNCVATLLNFARGRRCDRLACQQLFKPHAKKFVRSNFFSVRVINAWNQLPNDVVTSNSTTDFKIKLDNYYL